MDATHFRKVYIGILERATSGKLLQLQREDEAVHWACAELKEAGYIEGEQYPKEFQITAITVRGRMLLLQLKRDERDESWAGWLWSKGSVVFGFVLGASADLLKDVWVYGAHHLFPGIFPAP